MPRGWNASYTRELDHYVVTNVGWNDAIPPSGSVAFGCVANATGAMQAPTNLVAWGRLPPGSVPCPADLNGDQVVDAADLSVVLTNWGLASGGAGGGDVDGNGSTDAADLSALLAAWGDCG